LPSIKEKYGEELSGGYFVLTTISAVPLISDIERSGDNCYVLVLQDDSIITQRILFGYSFVNNQWQLASIKTTGYVYGKKTTSLTLSRDIPYK
jgi:hypothetical protein